MKNKIRIYESEIKRAVRRKLMENYIDSMQEEEQMTVYKQDEFNRGFDQLKSGKYGVEDRDGKIRSVTVNEEDESEEDENDVTKGGYKQKNKPLKRFKRNF
jgi:hypothetical protein